MQLNPYLVFNGECEAAFTSYAQILGAKIDMMLTHEGVPTDVPPEWSKKIMHARMTVGNTVLMASDCPPNRYQKPQGFSVSLNVEGIAEAERIFHALAEGGSVQMPIQQTFWAARFGMLVDRFGIPWMINCESGS